MHHIFQKGLRLSLLDLIRSDAIRYGPDRGGPLIEYVRNPGYKYLVWTRICRSLSGKGAPIALLAIMARIVHRHYGVRFGLHFPWQANIGAGFYVGHGYAGGIVISPRAVIGKNCNISHGVTIGAKEGGRHPGAPTIGDRVYIGPGAKVIGGIRVGNDVAIGANAVVVSDVPDSAVVVGVPAKVVSYQGSRDYIRHAA